VQGIHVAHIGTVCQPDGVERGWHKTVGVFPGGILNTERYVLNVLFGRNQSEMLFRMDDLLIFDVEDDLKRINNFSKLPGVIHPLCSWQTETVT
jgi:hypothetical protein